jgi:hypothetical protein
MDFGDVPAWVAAVVALGSMAVAVVAAVFASRQVEAARTQAASALQQADEARKAREAAEAGVEQARRSAAAAEQQAEAAREQVAILREQMAEQRAEKDRPRFEVVPPERFVGETTVPIDVRMTSGTDLKSIAITVTGRDVRGVAGAPASLIRGGQTIEREHFVVGAHTTVWVDLDEVLDTSLSVQVNCEALDGRTWELPPMTVQLTHPTVRNHQQR